MSETHGEKPIMDEDMGVNYFRVWFVEPIEKLKELPNGAGGFIAFMVGLALYERLIVAKLKLDNRSTDELVIQEAMGHDLGLSDEQRRIFWDMIRNGLLHQAMPKKGKTNYLFCHTFSGYPKFELINGSLVICIDPWKFTDRVMAEFLSNPGLIVASESYPLASIIPLTLEKFD